MRRLKLEVKLLMGSKIIKRFSTEANCTIDSDTYPLFKTIKKELNTWKKEIKAY